MAVTQKSSAERPPKVTEGGLSSGETAKRLSLPQSTLKVVDVSANVGTLGNIGKSQRPLTEVEIEFAKIKRELVIVKMKPCKKNYCRHVQNISGAKISCITRC
jgi:hypothetical protein